MAPFNPSPGQPNDPSYIGYSKPISDIPADQSKATFMNTIAGGISDVIGALDTSIKKGIQNTVYEKVDKERDQYTSALETVKTQLDNNVIAPAVNGAKGPAAGVIDQAGEEDPSENIPDGVQSGVSRIAQLSAAKAAGSAKINDTQYAAATLSIAKQLRAQYPGYREYIDGEVSKASGLPVANSYYQNLMLDINRQLTQIGKAKDDVGALMQWGLKQGVPNMAAYMQLRAAGDPKYPGDAYIMQKVNAWTSADADLKVQAAQRAERAEGRADKADARAAGADARATNDWEKKNTVDIETSNLTKNTTNFVQHHIEDNLQLSGMSDLRSLLNYMQGVTSGTIKASDAEVQQRSMELKAYRQYLYMEGKKLAVGPAATIGAKQADDIVNYSLTPIDTYIKLVDEKQTGPAYFHLNQAAAIKADDQHNWLVSKDIGALSRQLQTARSILGDNYFPDYIKSIMESGQDLHLKDLFNQETLSSLAPIQDQRGQSTNRTALDAIQHAKQLKGVPPTAVPEYVGKITDWLQNIADPNMPDSAKDQMIKWGFGKSGVTNELRMEYRDPVTGQVVPGKYRAFNLMLSNPVVDTVAKTAQAKPENYAVMKNWAEAEFNSLFMGSIGNLNKLTQGNIRTSELSAGNKFHFSYDDTNKMVGLVDDNNRPINASYLNRIGDPTIKRLFSGALDEISYLNSGIQRMRKVYGANPAGEENMDKHLLTTLMNMKLDPNIRGIPDDMAKAIIKTNKPGITNEELDKLLLGNR